jgi:hypothetical protein
MRPSISVTNNRLLGNFFARKGYIYTTCILGLNTHSLKLLGERVILRVLQLL